MSNPSNHRFRRPRVAASFVHVPPPAAQPGSFL